MLEPMSKERWNEVRRKRELGESLQAQVAALREALEFYTTKHTNGCNCNKCRALFDTASTAAQFREQVVKEWVESLIAKMRPYARITINSEHFVFEDWLRKQLEAQLGESK